MRIVFGLDRHVKIPIGKNVGHLPQNELLRYYQICDLGVVASYSNISLITYEMVASGLPVIEFKDGSAPTFFDETQLVFCETNPRDFVARVLYYLGHQGELETMLINAQERLRGRTWENSARSFITALTGTNL
jgi:O-antigen biosynthesis protein